MKVFSKQPTQLIIAAHNCHTNSLRPKSQSLSNSCFGNFPFLLFVMKMSSLTYLVGGWVVLKRLKTPLSNIKMVPRDEPVPSWLGRKDFRLVTFFTSTRNQKLAKNEPKFDSQLKTYFLLIFIINLAAKSYYSTLKTP